MQNYFKLLLPAYLNGTIGPFERLVYILWLRLDTNTPAEIKKVERLQRGMQAQTTHEVPRNVLSSIQKQIEQESLVSGEIPQRAVNRGIAGRLTWGIPIVLALLALGAIWYALPPAITLEWSVKGDQPSDFRVYRARLDGDDLANAADFVILSEVPAAGQGQPYTLMDVQLLPGQRYLYRVEAVDRSGKIVHSNTTVADSITALPGQLALLCAVLIVVYTLYLFILRGRNSVVTGDGMGMLLS